MAWVKKAGKYPRHEIWMDKPLDDRDFAEKDEAHERRSTGEFKAPPSSTAPEYSPRQTEALDKALKITKGASWVKKADHAPATGGKTWQEFQQEHKLAPVTDPTSQYDFQKPFLASLPFEAVKFMFESRNQVDPVAFQRVVESTIGIHVPLDKMDEFIQNLEMAYNSLRGQ